MSTNLTIAQAKRLYVIGGGQDGYGYTPSEWQDIRKEMEQIINAKSDHAGGRLIDWWGCWDHELTATAFARKVREAWKKEQGA